MRRYKRIFDWVGGLNAQHGPWPFAGKYPTRLCVEQISIFSERVSSQSFSKPSSEAWKSTATQVKLGFDDRYFRIHEFDKRSLLRTIQFAPGPDPVVVSSGISNVFLYYYIADKDWVRDLPLRYNLLFRPFRLREGSVYVCDEHGISKERLYSHARNHLKGAFTFCLSQTSEEFKGKYLNLQAARPAVHLPDAPPTATGFNRPRFRLEPAPHRHTETPRTRRLATVFNVIRDIQERNNAGTIQFIDVEPMNNVNNVPWRQG